LITATSRNSQVGPLPRLGHPGDASEMGERVIQNIMTCANGRRPPDRVIPAML
jgi:hypothetical protein